MVADALSRKRKGTLAYQISEQEMLVKEFAKLEIDLVVPPHNIQARIATMSATPTLRERIIEAQKEDGFLEKMRKEARSDSTKGFIEAGDGSLVYKSRLCLPKHEEIRHEILTEAHSTPYTAHPGGTKMYQDLKKMFWWRNMKGCIARFVQKCLIFQQVKAEH